MSGLTEKEIMTLSELFQQVPTIQKAVLFGSRAMGKHRHNSDVDIVLYGNQLVYADVLRVKVKIEETTLPYMFDVILGSVIQNKNLLEHINRHGIVIYIRQSDKK